MNELAEIIPAERIQMDLVDITIIAGVVIALVTFIRGVFEYSRQGASRRAEHFLEMRRRLKEKETFKEIADLLEIDDPKLLNIPFKDKRDYLGFFEEIAISMNSGLIRKEVAHYMFGYYSILCWRSSNFWSNVNRDSIYWVVFRDFVEQMEQVEQRFKFERKKFSF